MEKLDQTVEDQRKPEVPLTRVLAELPIYAA